MKKLILFLFFGAVLTIVCPAQTKELSETWIQQCLEKINENQSQVLDQSDLEIVLEEWHKNPIDLNKASQKSLSEFPFLNPKEVESILYHIRQYGPLLSIYELQSIEGLNLETAQLLSQFVHVNEKQKSDYYSPSELLHGGQHECLFQIDRTLQKNLARLQTGIYAGSPDHISWKYRFNFPKKIMAGFSMEKDAGEKWGLTGDFMSFHFLYQPKGIIQTLAIGDFQANFGNGLSLGTTPFFGKSSLVFQTKYLGNGIRPYRSLNESGFLRGIGLSAKIKNLTIDLVLSASPISAGIQFDSLSGIDKIASISYSGLHRTENEMSKKNSGYHQIFATHLSYEYKQVKLGSTLMKTEQTSELFSSNNVKSCLNLNQNLQVSADLNFSIKNTLWGAEYCQKQSGGNALLLNGLIPLHSKLDMLVLYRNYSNQFSNSDGNAWSAQSSLGNEKGLYAAWVFRPKRNRQLSVFADLFQSDAAKYQSALASLGSDYFIDYQLSFSKTYSLNLRYRVQSEEKNAPAESSKIKQLATSTKQQFRMQISCAFTEALEYNCRIEQTFCEKTNGLKAYGQMMYHKLSYHPKRKKWKVNTRICFFRISDYEARIYLHESDVLYNYSQIQLNGEGFRFYLNASYSLSKKADLHLKISHLVQPGENSIGSGWEEIPGSQKSDLKLQIRFRF